MSQKTKKLPRISISPDHLKLKFLTNYSSGAMLNQNVSPIFVFFPSFLLDIAKEVVDFLSG